MCIIMNFSFLILYTFYKRATKVMNIIFILYVIFTVMLIFFNIDIMIKMIATFFVTIVFALKKYYDHKHTITKYQAISKLQTKEIISIHTELIKRYSRNEIIELAKNDQVLDLSTGYEEGVMQSVLSQHYPAQKLLKKHPDIKIIEKYKTTVKYNEFDMKYQHIINELGRSVENVEVRYALQFQNEGVEVNEKN